MDNCGIARSGFGSDDVFVFGEFWIDAQILVVHDSRGGPGKRIVANRNNHVWLRHSPASYELRWRRQVGRITFWTTVLDPFPNQLLFVCRKTGVVLEVAELRICVPRRHAFFAHDFGDRRFPADRIGEASE